MSDHETRLKKALEGRYAVERQIGEGGMATVYLAEDLKHGRRVALKVMKQELAAAIGAERFLAEIETTANLQHPHILPLFDSGEADGLLFYVMPYVEGETLRDRVKRDKQLPVDDAIALAQKVVTALDYAHEQGVIHRDIKPANILLGERGEPLIADFGIALAARADGGRLTETGLSLGSPHYMSPEQATGDHAVGPPTDVYALGCVLYEMLVGEPPYTGSSAQAILGRILTSEPVSATGSRSTVPLNVNGAIQKSLEKLPADRFTSAREFAEALSDPEFRYGRSAEADSANARRWKRLTLATAGVAVALAVALGWFVSRGEPPLPVRRFVAPFGVGQEPISPNYLDFRLSPDGTMLVYVGPERERLWVRYWEEVEPRPIRGTARGRRPSISPDGLEIVFSRGEEIVRVALDGGGPARTIMDGTLPFWSDDGYIYARTPSGVARMLDTGGPVEPVTESAEGEGYILHDILPGGKGALVTITRDEGFEIYALELATRVMTPLTPGRFARYAPSGHLLYMNQDATTLMAVRFDSDAMELRGEAELMLDNVAGYSISQSGDIFYLDAGVPRPSEVIWVTRAGAQSAASTGFTFDAGFGIRESWTLSPDGTRFAFTQTTEDNRDIWVRNLDDGTSTRLLSPAERSESDPRWSSDGEALIYWARDSQVDRVFTIPANGTGAGPARCTAEAGSNRPLGALRKSGSFSLPG